MKILAIDDKRDNLTTLSALVQDAEPGATVLTASEGLAGIALAGAEDPDVILLDIAMPGMDGFEVCRRFKADDRLKDIPIVFLTERKTETVHRVKALEAGADGFLAKPLEAAELTAQIRAMVKVKAADRLHRTEQERLASLVAERTQELRLSQERFRMLLKNASDIIIRIDAAGVQHYVSPAVERITGFRPEELKGKRITDNIHPDDVGSIVEAWESWLHQPEDIITVQCRHKHKTGGWVDVECIGQSFPDFPSVSAVVVCIRDITAGKQNLDAVRASAERVRLQRDAIAHLMFDRSVVESPLSEALREVAFTISQVLQVDRASVWLLSEDDRELRCSTLFDLRMGYDEQTKVLKTSEIPNYLGALRRDSRMHVNDVQHESRLAEFRAQYLIPLGINSLLDSAIQNDGRMIGVLSAEHRGALRTWHPDEQSFISALASFVAQLLSNERRKRVEGENQRFRTIADNAVYGMAITDLQGNFVYVNRFFADIHGYQSEDLVGQPIAMVHSKSQLKAVELLIASLQKEGYFEPTEVWHLHRDGREFPMLMSGVVIKNETGQAKHLATSAVDMTAYHRAEQEYQTLFAEMLDGFAIHEMICDQEGTPVDYRFLEVNPAFEQMTGLTAEQLVGRTVSEVLPGTEPYWIEAFGKVAMSGEPVRLKHYASKLGRHFEVRAFCPMPGRFACVVQDVTEHLLLNEEKNSLQEQLHQSRRLESIGRLAGGIAHDFNNMLGIILGYSETAYERMHPADPLRQDVKHIMEAGHRSADLVRQLLAFSRKQTLQPKIIDLNDVVRNLERMLRRLIGEHIELEVVLATHIGRVLADPGQIEQVLMNLAVNARDAMADGGTLRIETAVTELSQADLENHPEMMPGRYTWLTVADTGCGMDKEVLSQIFDPFFTTKGIGQGAGLGLATAYGIVKQSGGDIWVESEPGQGTTFKIFLPQTETKPEAQDRTVEPGRRAQGRGHILVVEDEPSLRRLMESLLSRLGYKVTLAANGGAALRLVEEKDVAPDLIITDVVMPNMSGSQLMDRLQRSHPQIRALYMSGYADDAIAHHGVLDPGTPFIPKPFGIDDLAQKVEQAMRRP